MSLELCLPVITYSQIKNISALGSINQLLHNLCFLRMIFLSNCSNINNIQEKFKNLIFSKSIRTLEYTFTTISFDMNAES